MKKLVVTYANGDVDEFPKAEVTHLADRNSAILKVLSYEIGGRRDVLATLSLVNVRKWEWVVA